MQTGKKKSDEMLRFVSGGSSVVLSRGRDAMGVMFYFCVAQKITNSKTVLGKKRNENCACIKYEEIST